jgi:hypothetical protein
VRAHIATRQLFDRLSRHDLMARAFQGRVLPMSTKFSIPAKGVFGRTLIIFAISLSGCSSYRVYLHDKETKTNHFILIEKMSGDERCYDCYSRPDSVNWNPVCKDVKFQPSEK